MSFAIQHSTLRDLYDKVVAGERLSETKTGLNHSGGMAASADCNLSVVLWRAHQASM